MISHISRLIMINLQILSRKITNKHQKLPIVTKSHHVKWNSFDDRWLSLFRDFGDILAEMSSEISWSLNCKRCFPNLRKGCFILMAFTHDHQKCNLTLMWAHLPMFRTPSYFYTISLLKAGNGRSCLLEKTGGCMVWHLAGTIIISFLVLARIYHIPYINQDYNSPLIYWWGYCNLLMGLL